MHARKLVICSAAVVLCLVFAAPASAGGNLVSNPGFETGDLTDWTMSGVTGSTYVAGADFGDGLVPHSGNYFLVLGAVGADGFLSQTIADTPGVLYNFSFYWGSDGLTPNDFTAFYDGKPIFGPITDQSSTEGGPNNGYLFESVTVMGTGSDTIMFGFRNDPGYNALDDISFTAVPAPSAIVLAGMGVMVVAGYNRTRRRRAAD